MSPSLPTNPHRYPYFVRKLCGTPTVAASTSLPINRFKISDLEDVSGRGRNKLEDPSGGRRSATHGPDMLGARLRLDAEYRYRVFQLKAPIARSRARRIPNPMVRREPVPRLFSSFTIASFPWCFTISIQVLDTRVTRCVATTNACIARSAVCHLHLQPSSAATERRAPWRWIRLQPYADACNSRDDVNFRRCLNSFLR